MTAGRAPVDWRLRFWGYVEVAYGGCLRWSGGTTRGYGSLYVFRDGHQAMVKAHRLAWEMRHGPVPVGLFVCHHCDHPWCVNVEHLFLGTNAENVLDRNQKLRQAKGERNGRSKLTGQQVAEIRNKHSQRRCTFTSLGVEFGVSAQTIKQIIYGRNWKNQ